MCKAFDKNSVCCFPTYPKCWTFGRLFQNLGRFFQVCFTWVIDSGTGGGAG